MSVEDSRKAFLLKEDGGRIRLEDGSGRILLEQQPIGQTISPLLSVIVLFFILSYATLS